MDSVMAITPASGGQDAATTVAVLAIWLALIAAYWVPSLIAWRRHVPNLVSVVVINFFLAWTVIGWVVCLAWALKDVPPGGRT